MPAVLQLTTKSQKGRHQITAARQRLVLCRLMIEIMRSLHGSYAPASEPFGTRIEVFFLGLCVALGEIEGRPFSPSKMATYLHMSRTTVIRRLSKLERWGLVSKSGRFYYMQAQTLNSLLGTQSYRRIRRLLDKAQRELTILDTLPIAEKTENR